MSAELEENLRQIKEIVRELHAFSIQYESIINQDLEGNVSINNSDADLLKNVIVSLTNQLKILNQNIPALVERVGFFPGLSGSQSSSETENRFTKISYNISDKKAPVSLVISEDDKEAFIDNLSRSRLSIQELKKRYFAEDTMKGIGRPSGYAKMSNYFFKNFSNNLIAKGYFANLNRDLRKINSRFVVGTYVSIIFFTVLLTFFFSIFVFLFLLFFNVNFSSLSIITMVEGSVISRIKFVWIIFLSPIIVGFLVYFYPSGEAKSLGAKINQELPFVTIHMSAVASSGIQPVSIFKILLKAKEYRYTNIEFKKLMNLINFHGEDTVSALRRISLSSPSLKLRELLNGLSITITSGGGLHDFLSKHAEGMLFDYRLERERYNKISETFMDIYISIAIAAPMILMMIFVIIGSTGMLGDMFSLTTTTMGLLMILIIVLLNIFFLLFLRIKQPAM